MPRDELRTPLKRRRLKDRLLVQAPQPLHSSLDWPLPEFRWPAVAGVSSLPPLAGEPVIIAAIPAGC